MAMLRLLDDDDDYNPLFCAAASSNKIEDQCP